MLTKIRETYAYSQVQVQNVVFYQFGKTRQRISLLRHKQTHHYNLLLFKLV